jgi:aminoglycoside phosphotransferase (APT) family kinase protein
VASATSSPRSEDVAAYAAAVTGRRDDDVAAASVARFDRGDRHHVFRVGFGTEEGDGDGVVVRLSLRDDDEERAHVEREAAVLRTVGAAGAAPALLDISLDSPWFATPVTCHQLVAGTHRERFGADDLERLGALLRRVHDLPAEPDGRTVADDLDDYVRLVEDKLRWLRAPVPSSLQGRVREVWRRLRPRLDGARHDEAFRTGHPLVLTHGDVSPGNVLWSPEPVLIDWEYARLADPAAEVAFAAGQLDLDAAQRAALLRGYGAAEGVADRVRTWEPLGLLGSALWWVERVARNGDPDAGKPPAHYEQGARRRLEVCERLLGAGPQPLVQ